MKKLLVLFLILTMGFSLVSCQKGDQALIEEIENLKSEVARLESELSALDTDETDGASSATDLNTGSESTEIEGTSTETITETTAKPTVVPTTAKPTVVPTTAEPTVAPTTTAKRSGWVLMYYVDEFNQATSLAYLTPEEYIVGSFSNSATTNSELYVDIMVDEDHIAIALYEYGRNLVKNSSSRYDELYNITFMDTTGAKKTLTGTMYLGGDRVLIDPQFESVILESMNAQGSVSFYIEQAERTTTNYLFSVNTGNFSEEISKVR